MLRKLGYITKEFFNLIKERKLVFLSPLFAMFIILIVSFFLFGAKPVVAVLIYAGF